MSHRDTPPSGGGCFALVLFVPAAGVAALVAVATLLGGQDEAAPAGRTALPVHTTTYTVPSQVANTSTVTAESSAPQQLVMRERVGTDKPSSTTAAAPTTTKPAAVSIQVAVPPVATMTVTVEVPTVLAATTTSAVKPTQQTAEQHKPECKRGDECRPQSKPQPPRHPKR
ncbi:hypothetical protein [Kutzneria albida]|uniref:Putative secreted protein n=1 Tax=Kutzneria albida DSM 43870 TaxID=1449976 RepID=W5W058_9PSEU|nr:hypothetical protein [Kutzneria albida]AHH93946.1 putative secreted protein [Kutzneria albida DSM 43870]